ncbi:MAG: lysylphosphatidylglycerol synthase transmembrane domain-containing protein [Candidatus Nanohaloarchaea archaeon]|nr:lysylphosphatidylglycerol synthase transmembrane domain-containing protein [Candidatus Nanohaloarchaea archaeon]
MPPQPRPRYVIKLVVLVGIVVTAFSWLAPIDRIAAHLVQADPTFLLPAVLCIAAATLLDAVLLRSIVRSVGDRIGLFEALTSLLGAFAATILIGGISWTAVLYNRLRRAGLDRDSSAQTVVTKVSVPGIVHVTLLTVAAFQYVQLSWGGITVVGTVASILTVALLFSLLFVFHIPSGMSTRIHRQLPDKIRGRLTDSTPIRDALRRLEDERSLTARFLGLNLATVFCQGLALVFLFGAFHTRVGLGTAMAGYVLSTLVGLASMLPGGLVGFELTMVSAFYLVGVPAGIAIGVVLVFRLFQFWVPVILGSFTLTVEYRTIRRQLSERLGTD